MRNGTFLIRNEDLVFVRPLHSRESLLERGFGGNQQGRLEPDICQWRILRASIGQRIENHGGGYHAERTILAIQYRAGVDVLLGQQSQGIVQGIAKMQRENAG